MSDECKHCLSCGQDIDDGSFCEECFRAIEMGLITEEDAVKTYGKAKMVRCNGEAHRNPFIDHCMVCLPYWYIIPLCPVHTNKKVTGTGYCRDCKKHYEIGGEEDA